MTDRGWGICEYDERQILTQAEIEQLDGFDDVAPVWALQILRHWRPPRPRYTFHPVPWTLLRRANEDEDFRRAVLAAIRLGVTKSQIQQWVYEPIVEERQL